MPALVLVARPFTRSGRAPKALITPTTAYGSDAQSTVAQQPLTEQQVHRYYRSDARLWATLLRLRRLDRAWRRRTGRPYPFLLPRRIER